MLRQWRTRATAPSVFVRGRRCATSRRYSNDVRFCWIGYASGSSTHPTTSTASAWSSTACPCPWLAASTPVADDGASGGQLLDLAFVVRQRAGRDDLERIEARAVVQVNEREPGLRVAARANPATNGHPAPRRRLSFQHRRDIDMVSVSHLSKGIIRRDGDPLYPRRL